MTDLTLSISGSRTVPATDLADLSGALTALTEAHERDDPVAVRAGSLRWRDGGVWVSVTLALPTEPDSIEADSRTLAQVASETGLVDDEAAALEAINVR